MQLQLHRCHPHRPPHPSPPTRILTVLLLLLLLFLLLRVVCGLWSVVCGLWLVQRLRRREGAPPCRCARACVPAAAAA